MADGVAEVEQADGQTAQDDGEVEPAEEGALVGEEDFGFYAGGQGDAFAWVEVLVGLCKLVHGAAHRELFGGAAGLTWWTRTNVR